MLPAPPLEEKSAGVPESAPGDGAPRLEVVPLSGEPASRVFPFVLALALAVTVTLHFGHSAVRASSARWGGIAALALLLFVPMRYVVRRVLFPLLEGWSRRGRLLWGVAVGVAAILLLEVVPVPRAPMPPRRIHLEVTATGERGSAGLGTELWTQGLISKESGRPVALRPSKASGVWVERESWPYVTAASSLARLHWTGRLKEDAVLRVARHVYAGVIRVELDGETHVVDLSSPAEGEWTLPVPLVPGPMPVLLVFQSWLGWGADALCVAFLLLLVGLGLSAWSGMGSEPSPGRRMWLGASLTCAAVWSVYALAFWPGLMTVDSIDQWTQMHHWSFSNGHPTFHTLTNWLLTRVWESPVMVVLAQVLYLSLAFGLAVRELARWGVSRWILGGVTLLFALSPVNGVMVITLWKDIPYTATMLALSALLLEFGRTRGEALRSWGFVAGLGGAFVLLALVRHNGAPVSAVLLGLMALLSPKSLRRRALLLGLGCVGAFVLVNGPLYRALEVKPLNPLFAHSTPIHQVGAVLHAAPGTLRPDEARLLESIHPLEVWRNAYTCNIVNPLIHDRRTNAAFFESPLQRDAFRRLWLRLVLEHWSVVLRHQACVSALVWRILPAKDGYLYRFSLALEPNEFGLEPSSLWPGAREVLSRLLVSTEHSRHLWWVWQPALYLFLGLFSAVILALRLRQGWVLLGMLPVFLHSAALLLLSVAQDFRYQYPAYAVALVWLGLLFVPRDARARAAPGR